MECSRLHLKVFSGFLGLFRFRERDPEVVRPERPGVTVVGCHRNLRSEHSLFLRLLAYMYIYIYIHTYIHTEPYSKTSLMKPDRYTPSLCCQPCCDF